MSIIIFHIDAVLFFNQIIVQSLYSTSTYYYYYCHTVCKYVLLVWFNYTFESNEGTSFSFEKKVNFNTEMSTIIFHIDAVLFFN